MRNGQTATSGGDRLTGTLPGILIPMQSSLDQLIQITRTLAHDYDFARVVLASVPSNLQDHTPIRRRVH